MHKITSIYHYGTTLGKGLDKLINKKNYMDYLL